MYHPNSLLIMMIASLSNRSDLFCEVYDQNMFSAREINNEQPLRLSQKQLNTLDEALAGHRCAQVIIETIFPHGLKTKKVRVETSGFYADTNESFEHDEVLVIPDLTALHMGLIGLNLNTLKASAAAFSIISLNEGDFDDDNIFIECVSFSDAV